MSEPRWAAPSPQTNTQVYHQDRDCHRLKKEPRRVSAEYIEWHDLEPCEYCAADDIRVWVGEEHHHETKECEFIVGESTAMPLVETEKKPCHNCALEDSEKTITCPRCRSEINGKVASHYRNGECDG